VSLASDRLYRVASTLSQAIEVLGSIDKVRVWLKSPNRDWAARCLSIFQIPKSARVRSKKYCCVSTTGSLADARLEELPQAL
jgi:hypothetical protein